MSNINENLLRFGLRIAALVVIIDQLTKFLSVRYLVGIREQVIPGFDLVLRYNTGAAFSFLADGSGWQRWFLIILALIISICIVFWLRELKPPQKMEATGLGLILGGALGNLWDRVLQGHVIDFILLYYKKWEYPAFNIADSAICVGVILFVLSLFQKKKS